MSGIDDLVAELCPDGVEFRPLAEVGQFSRGNGLQKKDLRDSGVGCIHYGQVFTSYGTATSSTKSYVAPELAARLRKAKSGDLVVATTSENDEDVCKAVAWLGNGEIAISGDAYVFSHSLDPLYASYCFQSATFQSQKRRYITGTKVRRISGHHLARIAIPVPPIEIQHEIAGVLSKMESLEAELEAELEARGRQFAYYRDALLTFTDEAVPSRSLGDLGHIFRGKRVTKRDLVPVGAGVGCIHYGEIYTHFGTWADSVVSNLRSDLAPSLRFAEPGDVVIVEVGETVEEVGKAVAWMGPTPVAITDHSYGFRSDLNPTYVAYCLQTSSFQRQKARAVARTKVKTLLIDSLVRLTIPVPPRDKQDRIVGILDKFDALVNDISIGLPAEITARRRQYEHYRDRLLTFDQAAA
jgi:type I restriction enzyme S subunit